jgi:hypothetical protein
LLAEVVRNLEFCQVHVRERFPNDHEVERQHNTDRLKTRFHTSHQLAVDTDGRECVCPKFMILVTRIGPCGWPQARIVQGP